MEIVHASRSQIVVRVNDRTATVSCEMLMPTTDHSDCLIYRDSLKRWDAPFSHEVIDGSTRETILEGLCQSLQQSGRIPEVV